MRTLCSLSAALNAGIALACVLDGHPSSAAWPLVTVVFLSLVAVAGDAVEAWMDRREQRN